MHIIRGLGAGGTEMMCLRLARHWQHDFSQHIVALTPDKPVLERAFRELVDCKLTVGTEHALTHIELWRWLHTLVRAVQPDALLIHVFGVPHLIAASAARSAGIRTLAVKAGNPPPLEKASRRRWAIITLASRLLRCPIASCSAVVDGELRMLKVGMPKKSRPLPNGIDIESIAIRAARAREKRAAGPPVVGMVARLDAIKDHDTLLSAFRLLRLQIPEAELWIVGDGALRSSLEQRARRYGIGESSRFLGNRTDIPELLGQMDVYAFSTTRDEGFGIALIEAMAAGVPIVATDVPACREVLADGEGGILVPPANPTLLARAIAEVLQDQVRRSNILQAAHVRVRREYSIEECAGRWETLLFGDAGASLSLARKCAS
jgi:glycosyltransferase involved in cell wall biosynthesis